MFRCQNRTFIKLWLYANNLHKSTAMLTNFIYTFRPNLKNIQFFFDGREVLSKIYNVKVLTELHNLNNGAKNGRFSMISTIHSTLLFCGH